MKFSVISFALFCSVALALEIEGWNESGFAPAIKKLKALTEVTTSATKIVTSKYKTTEVKTETKTEKKTTITKTVTDVKPTQTTFTTIVKVTTKIPAPPTDIATKVKTATATPTSFPGCAATLRPMPAAECGVPGQVLEPALGSPYTISETSLISCQNACVCGETKKNCMAFSWVNDTTGSTYGTCTIYDKNLDYMGTQVGTGVLYDRTCFHRDTSNPPMPTQTMGSLKLVPIEKRAPLEDRIVGVLAGF